MVMVVMNFFSFFSNNKKYRLFLLKRIDCLLMWWSQEFECHFHSNNNDVRKRTTNEEKKGQMSKYSTRKILSKSNKSYK